jgi:hypothetical protein
MAKKLICFNQRVGKLVKSEKQAMYLLFCRYYSNVTLEQFYKDLNKKDYVFLLRDKSSLEVKGFSTIAELNVEYNGKNIRGFFSGDTVIDKDYWGQGTLGVNFLKFLFIQKLKKPFSPLYWFLISKGYKTYLLMANNFKEHYPRHEEKTPKDKKWIIDTFGRELYGKFYDSEKGLITYSKHEANIKDCLKSDVTPITSEMLLANDRIKYFSEQNPEWQSGDELACIAKMTFSMPFYYQYKVIKKFFRKKKKVAIRGKETSGIQEARL